MPTKSYALTRGGPKSLTLKWQGRYNNMQVTLDGQSIGSISNRKALKEGTRLSLPTGEALDFGLKGRRIAIQRSGIPLPGTANDPMFKVWSAGSVAVFIALLSLGARSAAINRAQADSLEQTIMMGLALIFAALGFLIYARQRWALWIAVALYALDTVLLVLGIVQGQPLYVIPLIVHALFLFGLLQGFSGFNGLEAERAFPVTRTGAPTVPDESRFKFTL